MSQSSQKPGKNICGRVVRRDARATTPPVGESSQGATSPWGRPRAAAQPQMPTHNAQDQAAARNPWGRPVEREASPGESAPSSAQAPTDLQRGAAHGPWIEIAPDAASFVEVRGQRIRVKAGRSIEEAVREAGESQGWAPFSDRVRIREGGIREMPR